MTWQSIIDEHGKAIFGIAFRVLGSVHDAEDVSQEVLLEAFKMTRMPDAGLLKRMAAFRAIDRLRRRATTTPLDEQFLVSESRPIEQTVEHEELASLLRTAISSLARQQSRCFWLRHVEGLSNQEIARIEAISESAVSTALNKARQCLRRSFQNKFENSNE